MKSPYLEQLLNAMLQEDQDTLSIEMRMLAQMTILQWFSNLLRVRLASQSGAQRAATMASLQAGLDEGLRLHETQTFAGPATELSGFRASMFKSSYNELSLQMMQTMGGGLTAEEIRALGLSDA